MKQTSFVLLSFLLLSVFSCTKPDTDETLFRRIDELCGIAPRLAIAMLDSLNDIELSEDGRHHCDLLMIKARDKGYVTHSSDSLILDVIRYYSRQKKNPLYAEALYYGGRVYSDLNKYDKAIEYYDMAVNAMSESDTKLDFQGSVHSQYGRLLSKLRLHDEAIAHLVTAVEICRSLKDSKNEVYDLQLLGLTYLQRNDRDSALVCFSNALERSANLPQKMVARSLVHLAYGYMKNEKTDSALLILEKAKKDYDVQFGNSLDAMAAQIYFTSGRYDSVYIHAKKLTDCSNLNNRKIGYQLLSSPELRDVINKDSLDSYVESYAVSIDTSTFDANRKEALFKYASYDRGRQALIYEEQKASRKRPMKAVLLLSIIPFVIFLMADILNFIQKNIGNSTADEDVSSRNSSRWKERITVCHDGSACEFSKNDIKTEPLKREDFCRNLRERASICKNKIRLPESLIHSEAYSELIVRIRECSEVEENDQLWESLLDAIKENSPGFIENLNLLCGCVPSISDLHTCILIRCNIGTKQMSNILGITQSGVVSRRKKLSRLAYNEEIGLSCMDNVVRLL